MIRDFEAIAAEADRKSRFIQLRRDMRYLKRVMIAYENAGPMEGGWSRRYHEKVDCERRLGKRYDSTTLFRMKGIIIKVYRLSKLML